MNILKTISLTCLCIIIQTMLYSAQEEPSLQAPSNKKVKCELQGTPLSSTAEKKLKSLQSPVPTGNLSPKISPQNVTVSAENTIRIITTALSENNYEKALQALASWWDGLPIILQKIKWRTPDDKKIEAQALFKHKVRVALAQCFFICLANSHAVTLDKLVIPTLNKVNDYQAETSTHVGDFLINMSIGTGQPNGCTIKPQGKGTILPQYDTANAIKQAFTHGIFESDNPLQLQNVLQKLLSAIPVACREHKEQFYHALIAGMISLMGSNVSIPEVYAGEGRADLVLMSESGNCIIEFKYGQSAKIALDQINTMNYCQYFTKSNYKTVHVVGIAIKNDKSALVDIECKKSIKELPIFPVTINKDGAYSIQFIS